MTVKERELLDRLVGLTNDVDERGSLNRFDEMRGAYQALPYSQVVQSKLRLLGLVGEREMADPNALFPSAAERLAGLQGARSTLPQSLPGREGRQVLPPGRGELEGGGADFLGDIVIRGARQHNLKNIDVTIPRFKFVVVTGVSGSGKSSLVAQTLHPALSRALHGAHAALQSGHVRRGAHRDPPRVRPDARGPGARVWGEPL